MQVASKRSLLSTGSSTDFGGKVWDNMPQIKIFWSYYVIFQSGVQISTILLDPKLIADKEANSQNELFLGSSTEPLSNKILTKNNQNIMVTMSLKNKNNMWM